MEGGGGWTGIELKRKEGELEYGRRTEEGKRVDDRD